MSESLVVIGNGMAAARFVEQMANRSLGRYAIAVIGDEPRLAYNRVLLSSVLAGEATSDEIELRPAQWWRDHGVTLTYGCRATRLDIAQRQVHLEDGSNVSFGKLVIATGSSAIRLNVPGTDLPGVHTFRDSADVGHLIALGRAKKRTVVIGGGLLGLEAAYGLAKSGSRVTLIHLMDKLMERQLDAPAAALLKRLVEAKGIEIVLNASTKAIIGNDRVKGLELADGRTIASDAVIFAAGIRPNAALAQEAGVPCNRGIVVDDRLRTGIEGVYALGECAEHRGTCYGLVEPAYEQARVLADHLANGGANYAGSVLATNLKVSGVSVFSAGDFNAAEGSEVLTFSDPQRGIYKKLVLAGGALAGAVLVGDTQDALWYLDLVKSRAPIAGMRNELMFGQNIAQMKAA